MPMEKRGETGCLGAWEKAAETEMVKACWSEQEGPREGEDEKQEKKEELIFASAILIPGYPVIIVLRTDRVEPCAARL